MRNKRYRLQFKRIGVGVLFAGPLMAASWFMLPALGQRTGGPFAAQGKGMPVTGLGPDYDLSWHSVDGGGVMFSTGGDFELSGTIGQPDAGGPLSGPPGSGYELTGGFWFALAPGDCNSDGGGDSVRLRQLRELPFRPRRRSVPGLCVFRHES